MADSNGTTSSTPPAAAPDAVSGEHEAAERAPQPPSRVNGQAEQAAAEAAVAKPKGDDAEVAEAADANAEDAQPEANAAETSADRSQPGDHTGQAEHVESAQQAGAADSSDPGAVRSVAANADVRPSTDSTSTKKSSAAPAVEDRPTASSTDGVRVIVATALALDNGPGQGRSKPPMNGELTERQGATERDTQPGAAPPLDPTLSKTAPRKKPLVAHTLQTGSALQEALRARAAAITETLPESKQPETTGDDASQPQRVTTAAAGPAPRLPASESNTPALGAPISTRPPLGQPSTPPLGSRAGASAPPLPPPHISARADGRAFHSREAAALADTQQDPARHQTQQQRAARSGRLSRTLRMEIKVGAGGPEVQPVASRPPPSLQNPAPEAYSPAPSERPVVIIPNAAPGVRTQRIGHAPDGADFVSGRAPLNNTDPMGVPNARRSMSNPPQGFSVTARDGSPSVPPSFARKRPSRPGERTIIMSRNYVVTKDWLFVALLVAALGVTASMLWSYRSQDAVLTSPQGDDTATLEQAMTEDQEPELGGPVEPAYAGAPVRATELRTEPAGAEVVAAGAVVGNTPVRVARADADVEYTLRLSGYEPARVRVGTNSPATIRVTLQPLSK